MSANSVTRAATHVGRTLVDGVRSLYVIGLALAGGTAVLAAPALLAATAAAGGQPPISDRSRLFSGLLLVLVPCLVWGLSWVTGGGGRAAGAALLAPGALAVAAAMTYGGSRGVVWLAPVLLPLGLLSARWVAVETRRVVGRWSGVPIAQP